MQFYFIRHAQSENNRLWDLLHSDTGRDADPELTAAGRQQAEHLARFLRGPETPLPPSDHRDSQNRTGFHLTHLYTSPMVRAIATIMPVARELDLPVQIWEDLYECGGIYLDDEETGLPMGLPGRTLSYFRKAYPGLGLPDSFGEAGWWNRPYEVLEQRMVRARRVWDELQARHGETEDRVAVVSHGAFYNHLMASLLGLPAAYERIWLSLNNASISRIDFTSEAIVIVYTNRAEFLPRELLT